MNQLQKALQTNALFSITSGIILILLNKQIATLFGTTNNTVFWITGSILIYFSATIWYEIKKQRRKAIIWIIIQDYVWVLGSIILMVFNPFELSKTGIMIIGIIALIVLFMGINQMVQLNKTKTNMV
ncbi:hypothetical protein [Aquimarina litoralis]|uniref:hypothetical protein n=1 Tax=Aquimarina litoralis TaxID=584605 RepID=UPI001C5881A4|nr:hypothetical protein [Aquimarina litoralis]MBW1294766.1 hypothetical protein [Aquimarina litoralis]